MYNRFLMRHLGIYYMLIASISFAATGAFAKILSTEMSSIETAFFRNVVGLVLIIIAIIKSPPIQKGGRLFLLIFRGAIGTLGLVAFFYNISTINLATAFTFSKTSPIFTALFSAFFLKERLSSGSWFAIGIGFLGILFIVQPNLGLNKSDFIGILSGVGAGLAYTSVRELRRHYDTKVIVLSFMLSGSLIPLFCMLLGEFYTTKNLDFLLAPFVMPSIQGWILIVLMGVFGTLVQVYLTKAYAASKKAGVAAGASYSDVIFSLFFGLALGDSLPNLFVIFGIILIILCGVLVAREK